VLFVDMGLEVNLGRGFIVQKFKESLQRLGVQVAARQEHITNEETAKQSLIIPFLAALGYDVFDPLEVRPEYDSDFGKKKGEKVDYAVMKNGSPIIFIEAKAPSQKLENHDSQLARYFNATPGMKVGIITNGVIYKFFTDLNASNIMDDTPFLELNITELSDANIEALSKFRKEAFDAQSIVLFAEELIYTSNLNSKLEDIFKNPPDDFVRYLIKDFSDTRVTQNVIDRFRPIVKKSISQALLNLVSQGLAAQSQNTLIEESAEELVAATLETDIAKKKHVIETTENELVAFELVKAILTEAGKDVSLLDYKDTTSYFGIFVKNPSNWLVRLNLEGNKKTITTNLTLEKIKSVSGEYQAEDAPKGIGISRVIINETNDIASLSGLIVACYEDVVRA